MTREEAIRILKNFNLCGVYHQLIHMNDTDSEAISMAIKALEQPEVIRCKDCKHIRRWRSEEVAQKFGQAYECAHGVFLAPRADDFCSMAERREG